MNRCGGREGAERERCQAEWRGRAGRVGERHHGGEAWAFEGAPGCWGGEPPEEGRDGWSSRNRHKEDREPLPVMRRGKSGET